jgi:hypothetical protein
MVLDACAAAGAVASSSSLAAGSSVLPEHRAPIVIQAPLLAAPRCPLLASRLLTGAARRPRLCVGSVSGCSRWSSRAAGGAEVLHSLTGALEDEAGWRLHGAVPDAQRQCAHDCGSYGIGTRHWTSQLLTGAALR